MYAQLIVWCICSIFMLFVYAAIARAILYSTKVVLVGNIGGLLQHYSTYNGLLLIGVVFMAYSQRIHPPLVPHLGCGTRGECMRYQCILFVSSTSGVILNSSPGALTDLSQLVKDMDAYCKTQFYVDDLATKSQY